MKKLIVVCVTLLIVLTAGIGGDAFAKSKKYYKYYLKAMPAGWPVGHIGDHAYVCIKGKRKKHGKTKTTKNYGCHSRTGGDSGGSMRKKWTVRKSSSARARKNLALCTQKTGDCNLSGWNYLRKGTCHQESNRMLYGAGTWTSVGHYVRGYYSYPGTFHWYRDGVYGKGWNKCKRSCGG